MRHRVLAGLALVAGGCSLVPQPDAPAWGLLIVNRSDLEIVVELEGGSRISVGSCRSFSQGLDPADPWAVRLGQRVVVQSDDFSLAPGVPVTVIEVEAMPDGSTELRGPFTSDQVPPLPPDPICPDARVPVALRPSSAGTLPPP